MLRHTPAGRFRGHEPRITLRSRILGERAPISLPIRVTRAIRGSCARLFPCFPFSHFSLFSWQPSSPTGVTYFAPASNTCPARRRNGSERFVPPQQIVLIPLCVRRAFSPLNPQSVKHLRSHPPDQYVDLRHSLRISLAGWSKLALERRSRCDRMTVAARALRDSLVLCHS